MPRFWSWSTVSLTPVSVTAKVTAAATPSSTGFRRGPALLAQATRRTVTTPTVPVEADLPEVARVMTDYNLIAMPVLDGDGRPVGIIAVDDVLELLLPEEWRRRAGAARS